MTRTLATIGLTAGLLWAGTAWAQDLPQWNLRVVCSGEADPACRAFEANAYSRLSGVWVSLPEGVRAACVEEAANEGHKSYRLLELCIEIEVVKLREQALAEAAQLSQATPADTGSPEWVSDGLRLLYR